MVAISYELTFDTTAETDIIDLTEEVKDRLHSNRVQSGVAVIFVPGSTGAITTIEYESGVLNDLVQAVQRLAPKDIHYEHDRRWGDGNGYSHVRAALLGPSLSVPVIDGHLVLGTWQQIVLLDFDNRPRRRRVLIQFVGEKEH